jgi:hypothetical protein
VIKPERFPDFFLIGAPRCGTTALSRYIASNPRVCFSIRKEPHYFTRIEPDVPIDPRALERDYLSKFFPHYDPDQHDAIGEGSVSYLYIPSAIDHILRINPDARFIVNVRDPISMIPSYHLRMTYLLEEDVEDLETAWELGALRAHGARLPKRATDPRLLLYHEVGRHAKWLRELFEKVGRDHCHVVVFDDWREKPKRIYREVLDFIGVPDDGRKKFKKRLPSQRYKNRLLHRLAFRPPGLERLADSGKLDRLGRPMKNRLKRLRNRLVEKNSDRQELPTLSVGMRAKLHDEFARDIDELGELLNRDLSHWG